jgi:hypothetical protein
MKQFDEAFRKQVKNAFRGYNADHLADAGWNSFAGSRGRKRVTAIIIPLWAKAASVALLLSAGALLTYRSFEPGRGLEKVTEAVSEPANTIDPDAIPDLADDNSNRLSGLIASTQKARSAASQNIDQSIPVITEDKAVEVILTQVIIEPDSSGNVVLPHLRDTASDSNVNRLFEEALKELLASEEVTDDQVDLAKPDGKTTLLAGFSGMMAKVDNMTSSSPGVSVGFYVDHQLTKRISVRPGLVIARHSLGIEGSSASENFDYAAPVYNGVSGQIDSYRADMSMVVMEIPLNFVITLWERGKSNVFIASGASTMFYLNQHFEGSYRNVYSRDGLDVATGSPTTEKNYTVVDVENSYEAFSHVDYLGMANLSAGYTFPLGKKNSMLFEPFLQLPLNDLTSRNVRIRYGGLSMKLSFGK